ncbi:MAG TPA: 3-deoxy-D-manno-octulosonic acid transferase [Tepidisphaeraceae bacterium]|jgi:3-deoxy-D-manno-octulosonic-acid transferase
MAINFYDIAYGFGVGVSAPVWVVRSKTRQKVLDAFKQRMGRDALTGRVAEGPTIILHAVSVGELNAARGLIDGLRHKHPDLHVVISTTTQTGHERAEALYGNRADITLIYYPLDFSAAVSRVLDTFKPLAVILMELELWPNFIVACERRGIPVILANGRITGGSYTNFRIGAWLTRRMFRRLAAVCAQEEVYAERFLTLGADPLTTSVTGTMKFDTASTTVDPIAADALAAEIGLRHPLWVAGSTGPGEEEIVLQAYGALRGEFPGLQLAIVPRKPDRFDEVAALIERSGYTCVRRSMTVAAGVNPREDGSGASDASSDSGSGSRGFTPAATTASPSAVILGDTMGELRTFYTRADVVFVGRTLVDLGEKQHGSDMIEPCALGRPTVVGPFTQNFAEPMNALRLADGIVEIKTPAELTEAIAKLLRHPGDIGLRGRQVVQRQRGATERTIAVIEPILKARLTA